VALLEVAREPGRARGPVALADQELGRQPAPVTRRVEPDEVADRREMGLADLLADVLGESDEIGA
jgi:hypothetical protein